MNEENLMRQMQEFKLLDEQRKKKITRYRDEGDKQIKNYRSMVDALKGKVSSTKHEMETKFREKEINYLRTIEGLK